MARQNAGTGQGGNSEIIEHLRGRLRLENSNHIKSKKYIKKSKIAIIRLRRMMFLYFRRARWSSFCLDFWLLFHLRKK